jgi:hypothetical protein
VSFNLYAVAMLATTFNLVAGGTVAALLALTSWPLTSIQKLATSMPQIDRDAVFVFLGD